MGKVGKSLTFLFMVLDMMFLWLWIRFFMDLDIVFAIFLWVWKWFWPKSYQNRKFLEFLAKKTILGTLVAFTICLRFFYDFVTLPYENPK